MNLQKIVLTGFMIIAIVLMILEGKNYLNIRSSDVSIKANKQVVTKKVLRDRMDVIQNIINESPVGIPANVYFANQISSLRTELTVLQKEIESLKGSIRGDSPLYFWARLIISLVFGVPSIMVIYRKDLTPKKEKLAIGIITLILGTWIGKIV